TGNLDSANADGVLEVFDELHAQGVTLAVITHNDEVSQRAQRRAPIVHGHLSAVTASGRGGAAGWGARRWRGYAAGTRPCAGSGVGSPGSAGAGCTCGTCWTRRWPGWPPARPGSPC